MPDRPPRFIAILRRIEGKLDASIATTARGLAEHDEELEVHTTRLKKHADCLVDHERRLKRLERKVNGAPKK